VAAINVLADWITKSKATTMMELQIQLKAAAEQIQGCAPNSISLPGAREVRTHSLVTWGVWRAGARD
jgi:translation initiation factor 2B subunit (eIF-2B alpha/beta/delta family)